MERHLRGVGLGVGFQSRAPGARESQRGESNPQPPHYECGALPIEATLAKFLESLNLPS